MFKKHRPWLRFIEGAEVGQSNSGSTGAGDTGENSDDNGAGNDDPAAKLKVLEADLAKWKGHARTWEERAKENQDAASRLKELEDSGRSEMEKLADRVAGLESDLAKERESNAALTRENLVKTIAVEEGVAEEDWKFLVDEDEELLREHAKRLAKPRGSEDPNQGRGARSGSSREAIIERAKKL